jgi:hypothetical protein
MTLPDSPGAADRVLGPGIAVMAQVVTGMLGVCLYQQHLFHTNEELEP